MSGHRKINDAVTADGIGYTEVEGGGLLLNGEVRLRDLVFILRDRNLEIGVKAPNGRLVTDVTGFDALAQRLTIERWEDSDQPVMQLLLEDGTNINLPHWVEEYGLAEDAPVELSSVMTEDGAPAGSDVVRGTDLGESLSAVSSGVQYVYGKRGDDVLYGGLDGDVLDGGEGKDTVSYAFAEQGVLVDLQEGRAMALSTSPASAADTVSKIENAEGSAYADRLTGDGKENQLRGLGGNDKLDGGGGNDKLDGGSGDDELRGGSGNDVYLLGHGTERDTIQEYVDNSGGGDAETDVIEMKPGITVSNNVRLRRSGDDLLVELLDNGAVTDSLTVENHFSDVNVNAQIEQIKFEDGTIWGREYIALYESIKGGPGNDTLTGFDDTDDVFDSDDGGKDILQGRGGDDVYRLGRGTGYDIIEESAISGDRADVIKIKSKIKAGEVHVRSSDNGNDLIVEIKKGNVVTDSLTVKDFYVNAGARIERVESADGTVLFDEVALDAAATGRTLITPIAGTSPPDGTTGDDVYDSDVSRRSDHLEGGPGDDTYWLGRGTGFDWIREWVKEGGGGNDVIRIKSDVDVRDVRIRRANDGYHYRIELLDPGTRDERDSRRRVTDMFEVDATYRGGYYRNTVVERVEFSDGTVWNWSEFASTAEITGDSENNILTAYLGLVGNADIFDSDAGGNDRLRGRGGDDVYWLGRGTDDDTIQEGYWERDAGDAGDVIKIKLEIALSDVRLRRAGDHLFVELLKGRELLNGRDVVTDSLKVENYYSDDHAKIERIEFAGREIVWNADDIQQLIAIKGGVSSETLNGVDGANDVFNSAAGGDDTLRGRGGDDVYWLGRGTGRDIIQEYFGNSGSGDAAGDVIKIKSEITAGDVRLRRLDGDLMVELLDKNDAVTDSLRVKNYYSDDNAKVESIKFTDGTIWETADIEQLAAIDGKGDNTLTGDDDTNDVFDSDAGGDDTLRGRRGNDVYWLGRGTGRDTIQEYIGNSGDGDDGDVIKIKSEIKACNVRLRRSGENLLVELLDGSGAVTDSLAVDGHYQRDTAKIERIEFANGMIWDADDIIEQVAAIRGGDDSETLYGLSNQDDVFDSDAGGDDTLHGRRGNDVYWLGRGTGRDTIWERYEYSGDGDAGDVIKIKFGITASDLRLRHSGDHLLVELVDENGAVTDSLRVDAHYWYDEAEIEFIEFADGTVWEMKDTGLDDKDDEFDNSAGESNTWRGRGGNDIYWLGSGTGRDIIEESALSGDMADIIKIKRGIDADSVRVRGSEDGNDLIVEIINKGVAKNSLTVKNFYTDAGARIERVESADGAVLWDESALDAAAAGRKLITETAGSGWWHRDARRRWYLDGVMDGTAGNDVYDSDVSTDPDALEGGLGDDTYWLGRGTGYDRIREYVGSSGRFAGDRGGNDVIRIKSDVDMRDVRIRRTNGGYSYRVELLDAGTRGEPDSRRRVTDMLEVDGAYVGGDYINAVVERVEFSDGTVWKWSEFAHTLEITGDSGDDTLIAYQGLVGDEDIFDSDAGGNDKLRGYSGDDVYWLGRGTDHDTVQEYYNNDYYNRDVGDTGDVIKIKPGIDVSDVRLRHSGDDLLVELLDKSNTVTDSLTVEKHYSEDSGKIERIEADGKVLLETQFNNLMHDLATFDNGGSSFESKAEIYDHYWDDTAVTTPGG